MTGAGSGAGRGATAWGALGLGAAQAVSLWPVAVLTFLARAAESTSALIASAGLLLHLVDGARASLATLGGALTGWLLARILRALLEGAALRQGQERQLAREVRTLLREVLSAAPRSLYFLFWMAPLELLAQSWRWLALLAAVGAYLQALGQGSHGFSASASLALYLTLLLPLAIAFAAWRRVGFVRSVARDQSALLSLSQAASALWNRPWPYLAVLFATGLLAAVADFSLSALVASLSPPSAPDQLELSFVSRLVSAILVSFPAALLELWLLQAFLALDLDERGSLPRLRPQPPPPVQAQPVIDALPVTQGEGAATLHTPGSTCPANSSPAHGSHWGVVHT